MKIKYPKHQHDNPYDPNISSSVKAERLLSLDALRGLLMILMAIDHANYFVARMHPTGEFWGIPLPQYRNIWEFLTRFVTHPCAPGFFFLMGIGMILFADSRRSLGWTEGRIMRHFFLRGLILILAQFFLENTAWLMGPVQSINPPGGGDVVMLHFGVLYGLGAAMIIGALFLRWRWIGHLSLSMVIIVACQFLVPDPAKASFLYSPLLRMLYIPGKTGFVQVFYSVLPWVGITIFGFVFGIWMLRDRSLAYRRMQILGYVFLYAFLLLRIIGGFGNIHDPEGLGLISFLNVTKYPPSLTFTLLNLGVCMIFVAMFSRLNLALDRWGKPLLVFGRSAFFFYIIHLYLFAFIGLIFASKGGTNLISMYLLWLAGLTLLYPLCKWYGNYKKKKPADSLWRFF